MQLRPPARAPEPAPDVPTALEQARVALGQRPAVTVLGPDGRQEQGLASLAQWSAKGAHLLEADLLLGPGDVLHLDAPLSWTTAAVCLAAWWAGVAVTRDDAAAVAVVHESRTPPSAAEDVLWLGDAIDGAPRGEVPGEAWVRAVQSFPDQPPSPAGRGGHVALRSAGRATDQAGLLAEAAQLGRGTFGLDADAVDERTGLLAVAVRPLVTLSPTVVLRGVTRDLASGDRVETWA